MTLNEVKVLLDARVLTCEDMLERVVHSACGADLMSDVLAFSKSDVILVTGLVNPQVIRTAEMMDIKAVCFVRGKEPSEDVLSLAREKGMVILATTYTMFITCGLLYKEGLGGGTKIEL